MLYMKDLEKVFNQYHHVAKNFELGIKNIYDFYNNIKNDDIGLLQGDGYKEAIHFFNEVEPFISTSWFRTREGIEREISLSIETCFIKTLKIGQSKKIAVGNMRGDDGLYAAFPIGIYENVYLIAIMNARYNDVRFSILQGNLDNYFKLEVIGRLPRCNDPKEMKKMGMILTEIKKEINFFDFGKVFRECIKDGTLSTGGP